MDELKFAAEEFEKKGVQIKKEWLQELYEINKNQWDLEADLRNGNEEKLGLEEIGRRAIAIRNSNNKRVALKNKIAEETGIGFKDIKVDHISE